MANLNIPFVILQPSQCTFRPTIETSKLISYNKYNLRNPTKPDYQDAYQTWLKEEFKNHDPLPNDGYIDYAPLQYQRFSDMTPKNLVVLGDSESGVIALCHQEWFTSKKKSGGPDSKTKRINKFVVMLQPRVLLVPSISEEVGPVRDHCLVRSPAQHVLVSISSYQQGSSSQLMSILSYHRVPVVISQLLCIMTTGLGCGTQMMADA